MRRFWRWVVGAVVVALGIYLAAGTYAVHQMIERLLAVPTVAERDASDTPTDDPKVIGYHGDPQVALGLAFEEVPIQTGWGPAPAWLIPADGNPKGKTWAIYVHGIGGRRENGYRYVEALHAAGIPVLLMSYRNDEGAPPTEAGLYEYGVTEYQDLDAAVTFVSQAGASDVLLIGDSMGGAIIGRFLAVSGYGWNVSAIILDSPALDFAERVNNALAPLNLPLTPALVSLAEWTVAMQHDVRMYEANSVGDVAEFPGPLLLIHGTGDRIIPISTSDRVAAQRTAPLTFLRTDADHLATWRDHPAEFDAAVTTFLAGLKTEAPR